MLVRANDSYHPCQIGRRLHSASGRFGLETYAGKILPQICSCLVCPTLWAADGRRDAAREKIEAVEPNFSARTPTFGGRASERERTPIGMYFTSVSSTPQVFEGKRRQILLPSENLI